MRIFTALPVPPLVQQYLSEVAQKAALANPDVPINWVSGANFHITLHFLGEIESAELETLKVTVASVASQIRPFEMKLGELGIFGTVADPRTVFMRAEEVEYRARELEALLNHALAALGFKMPELPWQPHITLGRVKPCTHPEPFVFPNDAVRPLEWKVGKIAILRSELARAGAHYTVVQEIPFK